MRPRRARARAPPRRGARREGGRRRGRARRRPGSACARPPRRSGQRSASPGPSEGPLIAAPQFSGAPRKCAALPGVGQSSEETCLQLGALAALDRRLQRAAGRELRDARGRDVHLLARVARIHAGASGALLARELPETGERDVPPALERVGDRFEEGVDRLARVTSRQLTPPRDLVDELLLGHVLPPVLDRFTGLDDPTKTPVPAQPCGFAGLFASASSSPAVNRGRNRTARRASASVPPSSRSTTHTAVCTTSPADRSASTDSSSAPPDVTTSSTRHTQSPASNGPSIRCAVP